MKFNMKVDILVTLRSLT